MCNRLVRSYSTFELPHWQWREPKAQVLQTTTSAIHEDACTKQRHSAHHMQTSSDRRICNKAQQIQETTRKRKRNHMPYWPENHIHDRKETIYTLCLPVGITSAKRTCELFVCTSPWQGLPLMHGLKQWETWCISIPRRGIAACEAFFEIVRKDSSDRNQKFIRFRRGLLTAMTEIRR